MKCQSNISSFCRKIIKKVEVKHIWIDNKHLEVCGQCFWILKQRRKEDNKPQSTSKHSLIHRKSKKRRKT